MCLWQARGAAQRAQREAELRAVLEQEVTERLGRAHEDALRQLGAAREAHR